MERHFALPALFAAAVHGGLFFGFPRQHAPIVAPKPPEPTFVYTPIEAPPEPIDMVPAEDSGPATPTEALRPTITDTPATPGPNDFKVPLVVAPPFEGSKMTKIPVTPPSVPTSGKGIGPGTVFTPGSLDKTPQTRFRATPDYPYEAKRGGMSGTVTVEFTVDESGRVLDPRVIDSTDRVFEAAAVAGVAKWRFEPGRREGRIVRFRMAVPIQFSLND